MQPMAALFNKNMDRTYKAYDRINAMLIVSMVKGKIGRRYRG